MQVVPASIYIFARQNKLRTIQTTETGVVGQQVAVRGEWVYQVGVTNTKRYMSAPFAAERAQRTLAPVCNKVLRVARAGAERGRIWYVCTIPYALNTLQHRCGAANAALGACELNICRNPHVVVF